MNKKFFKMVLNLPPQLNWAWEQELLLILVFLVISTLPVIEDINMN